MNRATKIIELPALTVDLLKANGVLIDNVFASLCREIGMKTVLSRAGFNKRFGTPMSDVIFILIRCRVYRAFRSYQRTAYDGTASAGLGLKLR